MIQKSNSFLSNSSWKDKIDIEFMEYTGKRGSLCEGDLIIKVNGKKYFFETPLVCSKELNTEVSNIIECSWSWRDVNLLEIFYPELQGYFMEILKVVNDNVPHGHCGGCLKQIC